MTDKHLNDADWMRGCILLFGLPRSGTTWLGKLFDSHPDTLYRHEPDSWRLLSMPRYPNAADADQYAELLKSFVAEMPAISALPVAGKLPVFPKSYLSRSRVRMLEASIWLARLGAQMNRDIPVFMHPAAADHARRRVVWKSIESLGRMGAALDALPNARAIHILRHPCGYIASILRGRRDDKFAEGDSVAVDHGIFHAAISEPLGDAYGLSWEMLAALTMEEQLAWRWVLVNEKARTEGEKSGRMLSVCYEDVCREPLAQVERMFDFTGLEMTNQVRAFVEASTTRSKDGYYSVFKEPLAAANRWQRDLNTDTVDRVMAIVRRSPFAEQYGAGLITPEPVS